MLQALLIKRKERKLQYQWYHNIRSYMVRMIGFEISGIFGFAAGLRWARSSLPTERLRQLSTVAPKCLSFICHRQRTSILPKASTLLCSQAAAGPMQPYENKKRTDPKGRFPFCGPDDRIRTCGILRTKQGTCFGHNACPLPAAKPKMPLISNPVIRTISLWNHRSLIP